MSLNLNLPETGITKHKDVYRVLRDNFNAINNFLTPTLITPLVDSRFAVYSDDPIKYYKCEAGSIHLFGAGIITFTGTFDESLVIFTLESDCRPVSDLNLEFRCFGSSTPLPDSYPTLSILTTGEVRVDGNYCTPVYVFLNGIVFYTG